MKINSSVYAFRSKLIASGIHDKYDFAVAGTYC
jgi:hypothetical protein